MNSPLKPQKPPAVFLVSIKITAVKPIYARRFAKMIADEVETTYRLERAQGTIHYELNLSKWEPL